jgi:hypothetical protein
VELTQRLEPVVEEKDVVEVWGRDDVPGTTSQRTRFESVAVGYEVGDDHFQDVVRQGEGPFVRGTHLEEHTARQTGELERRVGKLERCVGEL